MVWDLKPHLSWTLIFFVRCPCTGITLKKKKLKAVFPPRQTKKIIPVAAAAAAAAAFSHCSHLLRCLVPSAESVIGCNIRVPCIRDTFRMEKVSPLPPELLGHSTIDSGPPATLLLSTFSGQIGSVLDPVLPGN